MTWKRAWVPATTAAAAIIIATALTLTAAPRTPPTAEATAAAAEKKKHPIITVNRKDGAPVRGQYESSDGLHIRIKPAEGKSFGELVEIAWSDVKTVSNGLTQRKSLDAWKIERRADLCDDCKGELVVPCDVCKGVSHDPAASKDCKTCKGAMTVACKQPKCDHGIIPCPAPCIKPGEGKWKKDEAGKNVRVFPAKGGGSILVSEGHIGEILPPSINGEPQHTVPCPMCGKTMKVVCPMCHSRTVIPCPTCKANKTAANCTACDGGSVTCKTCNGSGLKGQPPATATPTPPTPTPPPPAKPADAKSSEDGF